MTELIQPTDLCVHITNSEAVAHQTRPTTHCTSIGQPLYGMCFDRVALTSDVILRLDEDAKARDWWITGVVCRMAPTHNVSTVSP